MLPLSDLPSSVLQGLEGIIFDIDDTVTCDGRLEPAAHEALWRLSDAGLVLIAVTGRPLGWADVLGWVLPIHVFVAENGAGWVQRVDGKAVQGYYYDAATRREHQSVLDRVVTRVAKELPFVALTQDNHLRRCDVAFDIAEQARLSEDEVKQVCAVIESEGARTLVSSVHAHALMGEYDKAKGVVRAAKEQLDLDIAADRSRWLFVGDSGNDAAAFGFFEHTVGVANVRKHLKSLPVPPRYVTQSEFGDGFAELAATIVAARGHSVSDDE